MGNLKFKQPLALVAASVPTGALAAQSVTAAKIANNTITSGQLATSFLQQATGTIVSADVTGTGAGQFGHANGYPLVAAQGTHNVIELISVVLHFDFITAAYTAGGNITANWSAGGAAVTGLVSAANSLAAATDKSVVLYPLTTVGVALVENGGLNLVSSVAFTQPGTAAGVVRYIVNYRVHATGF